MCNMIQHLQHQSVPANGIVVQIEDMYDIKSLYNVNLKPALAHDKPGYNIAGGTLDTFHEWNPRVITSKLVQNTSE